MNDSLFVSLDKLLLEFGRYDIEIKKYVIICIIICYFSNEVKSQKNYLF